MLKISLVLSILLFPQFTSAEILFADNFDAHPDFDTSQDGGAVLTNVTHDTAGGGGWTQDISSNRGGDFEAGYINATGAHGGSGKGFIQYWDKTVSWGYAQGSGLQKTDIPYPNEFFLGYWYRVDPLWDWGSAASLKLLKIHFDPDETWDISWQTPVSCSKCGDNPSGWCSSNPESSSFVQDALTVSRTMCTDQWGRNLRGSWDDIGDGSWHSFVWHFNHSQGRMDLYVDGALSNMTDYTPDFQGTGWDSVYGIQFGGNITDGGGGVNEMYSNYDDLIIATTLADVETFMGLEEEAAPVVNNTGFSLSIGLGL